MNDWFQANVDLIAAHPVLAVMVVFLVATGEALLLVGLVVPSTVVLVSAGAMVGMGKLGFFPVFMATLLGAIVGDALSYWIGRHWRDDLRSIWPFSRYQWLFAQGEAYFAKHGGKSIFIGRFVPGIKAIVPAIAGMAGMNPARFTVINVVSAVAWTIVHLLPGIGLGRGIDIASAGNPRLLALLGILALLAAIAWYAAKFAYTVLLPLVEESGAKLAARIGDDRPGAPRHWRAWLKRLLTNHGGLFTSFSYVSLALVAILGFSALAMNLLLDPDVVRSDQAISTYLRALHTDTSDIVMVVITMLGDSFVLTGVALALTVSLLWYRQFRLAASALIGIVIAALFVPMVKGLVHRTRPSVLYSGLDSFSFPSGHATLTATILGIAVLIVAHQLPMRWRHAAYLTTAVLVCLVAFSRVYLQAHWPSDVFAGVLAGAAIVFAMALVLQHRPLELPAARLASIVGICLLLTYGTHLLSNLSAEQAHYRRTDSVAIMTPSHWRDSGFETFAVRRILLGGRTGEPVLAQTTLSVAQLTAALRDARWQMLDASWTDALVSAVLPWKGSLVDRPALPLTNNGRRPLAILARPAPEPDSRYVLRIWQTGNAILVDKNTVAIQAVSITREMIRSFPFGYRLVSKEPLSEVEMNAAADQFSDEITRLFPTQSIQRQQNGQLLWLIDSP